MKKCFVFFWIQEKSKQNCDLKKMSKVLSPLFAIVLLVTTAVFCFFASSSVVVEAAWCNDQTNVTGPMNNNPVDMSQPVFVKRVHPGSYRAESNSHSWLCRRIYF